MDLGVISIQPPNYHLISHRLCCSYRCHSLWSCWFPFKPSSLKYRFTEFLNNSKTIIQRFFLPLRYPPFFPISVIKFCYSTITAAVQYHLPISSYHLVNYKKKLPNNLTINLVPHTLSSTELKWSEVETYEQVTSLSPTAARPSPVHCWKQLF